MRSHSCLYLIKSKAMLELPLKRLPRFLTTAVLQKHLFGDRVSYAAALTDGRTAIELAPKSSAATETAAYGQTLKHAYMQRSY